MGEKLPGASRFWWYAIAVVFANVRKLRVLYVCACAYHLSDSNANYKKTGPLKVSNVATGYGIPARVLVARHVHHISPKYTWINKKSRNSPTSKQRVGKNNCQEGGESGENSYR